MKILRYATLSILLFWASATGAATYTFTGAADPFWTNTANWSPAYPGTTIASGDSVHIQAYCISTGVPLLTINGFLQVVSSTSEFGNVENFGEIWINVGTFVSSSSIVNKPSGTIQLQGAVSIGLTNEAGASITVYTGAFFNGSFSNAGTFINNGQTTTATATVSKILSGGTFTNNGIYSITTRQLELHSGGTFINSATGSFEGDQNNSTNDNLVLLGGSFVNSGTVEFTLFAVKSNFTFDFSPVNSNFRIYAGFTMTISSGTVFNVRFRGYNNGTLINNGSITFDYSAFYTFYNGYANSSAINNGTMAFGDFVMESNATALNTNVMNIYILKMYDASVLTNSGDLNVLTQGEMINTGSMVNTGTVDMMLTSGTKQFFIGNGAICTNHASGIYNVGNGAQLRVDGVFTNHGIFNNEEKVLTTSSSSSTAFANFGTVNNLSGSTFITPKNFTNHPTGIFNNNGSYLNNEFSYFFENKGVFNNNATGYVKNETFFNGNFKIREGVFNQNGTFDHRPSGALLGPLTNGTGLITSGQTLFENGCPVLTDSLILSPGGSFKVKMQTPLNGCNQGYHDLYTVQDTVFLDGTLVFETGGFYQDFTFTAIEANKINGVFSNFNWPTGTGYYFGVIYEPTKVKIVISSTPLPVELLAFRAEKQGESVNLSWRTASEHQNKGFWVQHSADGVAFENIQFVQAAGGDAAVKQYAYLHESPLKSPVIYYRLRQEDMDGGFSFSDIQSVANPGSKRIAITPNPVSGPARVHFESDKEATVLLFITDLQGRLLYAMPPFESAIGENQLNLPAVGLPSGMYFLQIESDGSQDYVRFIVR